MSKYLKFTLASFLGLLFFVSSASASMFPNDAIGFNFDSYNNTTCTSSSSVLFPAVDHDRTILYLKWTNQDKNNSQAADLHLGRVGVAWPNGLFLDTEREIYGDSYVWQVLASGTPMYCNKSGNLADHINISGIYVDYNLASSSPVLASVSSGPSMDNPITAAIARIGSTASQPPMLGLSLALSAVVLYFVVRLKNYAV